MTKLEIDTVKALLADVDLHPTNTKEVSHYIVPKTHVEKLRLLVALETLPPTPVIEAEEEAPKKRGKSA